MKRLLLPFVLLVAGCGPEIGDPCDTSTDCSQSTERLCDVSQEGGYCTVFDCERATCPEEAECVLFGAWPASVGECRNDTGTSPSQRSFCMLRCDKDSDCRTEHHYHCRSATDIGATNLDGASKFCVHDGPVQETPAGNQDDVCVAETPSDG